MPIVRRAMAGDAEGIHTAHMTSIREICSKDYSEEEILAWGHRPFREDRLIEAIQNDLVWVVEDGKSIEGYGHLKISEIEAVKRGHLLGLYLTPKVAGQSFGSTIVDLMMEQLQSLNVTLVTLAATITAKNFYHKMGFIENGPETKIRIDGTPIRCFPMKMEL